MLVFVLSTISSHGSLVFNHYILGQRLGEDERHEVSEVRLNFRGLVCTKESGLVSMCPPKGQREDNREICFVSLKLNRKERI